MNDRLPTGLILVAVLQFIAPAILPPSMLTGLGAGFFVTVVVVFALLGWNLLRRRAWSRVATVFVQGFSIIVHTLVLLGHVRLGGARTAPVDYALIGTFLTSIILSGAILYYVDLPDVQTLMQ